MKIVIQTPLVALRWSSTDVTDLFLGSKLRLLGRRIFLAARSGLKLFNGLDDFEAALYACANNKNDVIHSDHGYLETWEIPGGPT